MRVLNLRGATLVAMIVALSACSSVAGGDGAPSATPDYYTGEILYELNTAWP